MSDDNIIRGDVTVEALDAALLSMRPLAPTKIIVGKHNTAVFKMIMRADEEGWNWRRLKRELRRAETSTYVKRAA